MVGLKTDSHVLNIPLKICPIIFSDSLLDFLFYFLINIYFALNNNLERCFILQLKLLLIT